MDENLTIEAPDYRQAMSLAAAPEVVYAAVSTAAGVSGWWMPTTGSGSEGGELRMAMPPGPVVMRVDTARPFTQVRWSVVTCDFMPDWVGTTIEFDLAEREGPTVLDFRHEGLTPRLDCFDQCRQGWEYYLASLQAYVETGTGRPGNRH